MDNILEMDMFGNLPIDEALKNIFHVDKLALIKLVNSIFKTHYNPSSELVYLNSEFVFSSLEKIQADLIFSLE